MPLFNAGGRAGHGRPEERANQGCDSQKRLPGRPTSRASDLGPLFALALWFTLPAVAHAGPPTPNILFIIMDDVGIDQMRTFGYGGQTPPSTPTLQQIADEGVRFTNAWSMPACSTTRALLFTGRFPLRTNVFGAQGPDDLANSHVSPFEVTVPKLLKLRGYRSALFGKFHLGVQWNNPYGLAMPSALGWDYYAGWLDETGDPPSIDTTAGGVAPEGTWSCGFVPGSADRSPTNPNQFGADTGACYAADNSCRAMSTSGGIPPGRTCRDSGGIFDPGKTCQSPRPSNIDFSRMSGHYVSPYMINRGDGSVKSVPPTDIRARTFRGSVPVDDAIAWIASQPPDTPWMATVSFSSAHTPLMQPPPALLASGAAATSGLNCTDAVAERVLMNQLVEAIDTELERLLVATGIATRNAQGRLVYHPETSDTMVIVVGDNGSFGTTVKLPFDPSRSKGTAYQTGVWVPLVVAGPLVKQPNRSVGHMVNLVDLYQLFGEIAGIDVPASVPRPIDSTAMLPYLANPAQASIRDWNFTQVGPNLHANGAINGPCVFPGSCSQIPVSKSVCEDNGGVWWGQGSDIPGLPPEGLKLCCDVNVWIAQHPEAGLTPVSIQPLSAVGIRNARYKIVRNSTQLNDAAYTACVPTTSDEFYEIDEAVPNPRLDRADLDLKTLPSLTPDQQANYDALSAQLARILNSQTSCPGDGNLDGRVDQRDIEDWSVFAGLAQGKSSWYDINLDGLTDRSDLAIIQDNLGTDCRADCRGCAGSPPASGWVCVRGAWVPPGDPLAAVCVAPAVGRITVSPGTLRFAATKAGVTGDLSAVTSPQTVTIDMTGGTTAWTVTANQPWVQITKGAGSGSGQFAVGIVNPGNVLGASTTTTATVTILPTSPGWSAAAVAIKLSVDLTGGGAPPFGQIDTPAQLAGGLVGSIGVTGWALDDVGVAGVKIYRTCFGFDDPVGCQSLFGHAVVFVGDAVFVQGVRPDVEAAYPGYPASQRAGWGYLMLTNTLPHVPHGQLYGGQGPITIYAVATDVEGRTSLLGRSVADATPTSVTFDNDHIAKPFGAIDTPQQGEVIDGTRVNFGWVLTPDSNTLPDGSDILVPPSGSTIRVFVDGTAIGTVTYNQCRGTVGNPVPGGTFCDDDVSNAFGTQPPSAVLAARTSNPTRHRNLDAGRGAIGSFVFDTQALANGIHSIAWSVTDSAGRTEGIGSRYFSVLNSGAADGVRQPRASALDRLKGTSAPQARALARSVPASSDATMVVRGRVGFDLRTPYVVIEPDDTGIRHVQVAGLDRLELDLGPVDAGALVAGEAVRDLPPGARLEPETGTFTWAPGPGVFGSYRLVFLRGEEQVPFDVRIAAVRSVGPGEAAIRMNLDAPWLGQEVSGPFDVGGWALDPAAWTGHGIGAIHVWAQRTDAPGVAPQFLGVAELGGARPDIAAAYGPQFDRTGFGVRVERLEPGQYEITAYAWNVRTQRWEDARSAHVTAR